MLMNWHGWPPQQQGVTQLAAPGAPRLGAPWTHMSAGSNDTSLCAVVMPTVGVGWHWMPGYTNATSGSCDVVCASNPCYEGSGLLVSTGLSEYPSVSVLPWDGLPVRCACICNGTNSVQCAGARQAQQAQGLLHGTVAS